MPTAEATDAAVDPIIPPEDQEPSDPSGSVPDQAPEDETPPAEGPSDPETPPAEGPSDPETPPAEGPSDPEPPTLDPEPIVPIIGRRTANIDTTGSAETTEDFRVKYDLVRNPYSWSESAHMIFLEQPIRYSDTRFHHVTW